MKEYAPVTKDVLIKRDCVLDNLSRSQSPKNFKTLHHVAERRESPLHKNYKTIDVKDNRVHILKRNKLQNQDFKPYFRNQISTHERRSANRNITSLENRPKSVPHRGTRTFKKPRKPSRKKLRQLRKNEKVLSKTVKRLAGFKRARVCTNYMQRIVRLTNFSTFREHL